MRSKEEKQATYKRYLEIGKTRTLAEGVTPERWAELMTASDADDDEIEVEIAKLDKPPVISSWFSRLMIGAMDFTASYRKYNRFERND
jgi:hypothetical protein